MNNFFICKHTQTKSCTNVKLHLIIRWTANTQKFFVHGIKTELEDKMRV